MTDKVAVQDLRIGMFVHLDLGWMSHPFPLSSFKIASAEQIDIIQSLGLTELRWSPARSDVQDDAPTVPVLPEVLAEAPAVSAAEVAAEQARRLAEQQLQAQQAALRQCERQYAEACRELRRMTDRAVATPEAARDDAQALSRALLNKMLTDGELCVRVLGEPIGDRASSHAMNVTIIALLLARAQGMADQDLLDLGTGALLHDIGKLQLPDRVRLPREDFSAAEQALYRDHVLQGVTLGRRMGLSPGALLVLAQHHEHADATGFPKGQALEGLSPAARIVAMVNHYDNLCNAAVPSRSLTPHEALSRMFAQSRSKFDATMLSAFIRLMGIYPPGSVVQLSDERYAMVMSVNAARPLKPRVMVFDSKVASARALHLNLETTPDLGIRRSIKPDQLPARAAEYLAPRQRVAYFFDVEPVATAGSAGPGLVAAP